MNRWERIKHLLSVPTYRTRIAFFLLLGAVIIVVSILFDKLMPASPWGNILVEIAGVFFGVGFVSILWDVLGGDPVELRMLDSFDEIDHKIDSVFSSMSILSDLVESNIGIERIWSNRGAWENDPVQGLDFWKKLLCQAQRVDIVSNTLWTRWFHDDDFSKNFFEGISKGNQARILIYDPNSEVLLQRAKDERDNQFRKVFDMQSEISSTLDEIKEGMEKLDDQSKGSLKLRLSNRSYHLAQIIRADEKMMVSVYLSGKSGTPSPTFLLSGSNSQYFKTFLDQIEIYWGRGHEVTHKGLHQLLKQDHNKISDEEGQS